MARNTLVWIVASLLIAGTAYAGPDQPASPFIPPAVAWGTGPLAQSSQRAAAVLGRAPARRQSAPSTRRRCAKGVAIGTAVGGGLGFAWIAGLLASTGGSDSGAMMLRNVTITGAGAGALVGTMVACD